MIKFNLKLYWKNCESYFSPKAVVINTELKSRIRGRGGWSVGCRHYNFMLYIALDSIYFSMTFPPSPLCYNDHSANLWLYNLWQWVRIAEYIEPQTPNWNSPGFGVDLFQKTSTYLMDKDNCDRFSRARTQCTFCQQDLSLFLSFSWNLGMQSS